jgi:hypothetical protein
VKPHILIAIILLAGCESNNRKSSDNISGTYVMEKTNEVKHELTGDPVGMAVVRDTIIITRLTDGYQVENREWKMNQFDEEGWVKQEQRGSRTYLAKFDEATQTLNSEPVGLVGPLEVKVNERMLVKGKEKRKYERL